VVVHSVGSLDNQRQGVTIDSGTDPPIPLSPEPQNHSSLEDAGNVSDTSMDSILDALVEEELDPANASDNDSVATLPVSPRASAILVAHDAIQDPGTVEAALPSSSLGSIAAPTSAPATTCPVEANDAEHAFIPPPSGPSDSVGPGHLPMTWSIR
jgi:hypothetical protein